MKQLDLRDIKEKINFGKLFTGRIQRVDSNKMILKVELQDIPGVIDVGIPFGYISNKSGSFNVHVPVVGDTVIVGMKQENDWEVLGYRMNTIKDPDGNSMWENMRASGAYIKPTALQSGDYGVGVRSGSNAVEFFMLGDGRMLLSAGLVYMLFNQSNNSLRQMMAYCNWDSGKFQQEWGDARYFKGDKEHVVKDERLWRVKDEDKEEEIGMGFINKDGAAEQSGHGKDIRYRVKIKDTEILIDADGGVEINAAKNVDISVTESGEHIRMENNKVNVTAKQMNVKAETNITGDTNITGNVDVKGNTKIVGDIDIKGNEKHLGDYERVGKLTQVGNVDISGSTVMTGTASISGTLTLASRIQCLPGGEIGGVTAVVLETILPLLQNHTHMYSTPQHSAGMGPSMTSMELALLDIHKTTKFKAG